MTAVEFLQLLNEQYLQLHEVYEEYFWVSYMGDHSQDDKYQQAQEKLEAFKSDQNIITKIQEYLETESDPAIQHRLEIWQDYFQTYAMPADAQELKNKVNAYETKLQSDRANLKTGYTDPYTGEYVQMSIDRMRFVISTNSDEKLRKSIREACQEIAPIFVNQLIQLVKWRNEFAQLMGYENFYEYKAQTEERMSSKEIFRIFDTAYEQLKVKFEEINTLEKDQPGLRKPWNFGYMMAGDFTKEEDQYFQLDTIIKPWAQTFTGLGINYQGAKMKLDLLEREGKYNNGFCHQPIPTHYIDGKRITGTTNFTCNAIYSQIGSGARTAETLFHEGGHAAHFSNMAQQDIILNTEYAPMGVARAETQSMFCDTILSSIEWRTRYAKNVEGKYYPFDLYERKVKKLHKISNRSLLSIAAVVKLEEHLYVRDTDKLTPEYVINLVKEISQKYFNYSQPELWLLTIPHIYAWNSSAYYHGYGMAEMALEQFRHYFYEKYGYIVDNPEVGKLLTKGREKGSSEGFKGLIKELIGQDFSPQYYIDMLLRSEEEILSTARERMEQLQSIPKTDHIDLNAHIELRDGKTLIAKSDEGFDTMCQKFGEYIVSKK